jgi:hypothetical protein
MRLSEINFEILAQDQHIKASLLLLMDRILERLCLANIKGPYMIYNKKIFWPSLKIFRAA